MSWGSASKSMAQKTETENSITAKPKRGTFAATFLLACIAALDWMGWDWTKSRTDSPKEYSEEYNHRERGHEYKTYSDEERASFGIIPY